MKSLSVVEILVTLIKKTCPECGRSIELTTCQSEAELLTTSGTCEACGLDFMIDRTLSSPHHILGGHAYEVGEGKPVRGRDAYLKTYPIYVVPGNNRDHLA